ncbi:MAG: hypothetical protein DBY43_06755 [Clostridiaceae bacterium]|nr:MAG: hypothetical protein DBY43_06755 [Clostridiaceae bacterium]
MKIKRKSPLRIKKSALKKTKSVSLMTQRVAANAKTNLLKLNVNLTNTKKSPKTRARRRSSLLRIAKIVLRKTITILMKSLKTRTIKKLNPLRKTKRTSAT